MTGKFLHLSQALILSFCCVLVGAVPPPKNEIVLEFDYLRYGKAVCAGKKRIVPNETYLLCERQTRDHRVLLKATAVLVGESQVRIEAVAEEITSEGKIINVSKPRITALFGEPASIEQGDIGRPQMRFSVNATLGGGLRR
ncbi:MAG: hypothetical protein AB7G93_23575 [Bdellovibrionales bacterium]